MTDPSPVPPLDNHRSESEHDAIVARIVRLEVTSEYTIKTLDLMQRRMDDGFKQLTEAIGQVRAEMNANTNTLRSEINASANQLRGEMDANTIQLRKEIDVNATELRKEMSTNFHWLMGVQISTLFAVMGMLARMANFF